MARLFSSGFELNSLTAGVEITSVTGSPTIQTGIVRSGTYALRANPTAATAFVTYTVDTTNISPIVQYFRSYIYISSYTNALDSILVLESGGDQVSVRMNSNGTLELWNDAGVVQIGSDSSALSLDQWYRLEVSTTINAGGDITNATARIDGADFASGAASLGAAVISNLEIGAVTSTTCDIYFDDVAINDDSGSFQSSWPGAGEIIHLRPNAAGDNEAWDNGTGTTFAEVDEVTPDNVATYISEEALNSITDFNLDDTPAALASDDIINCVQVGVRFAVDNPAGSDPGFVLRVKASAGGTVEEGVEILTTSTTYNTNSVAIPHNYNLTLYDLPGASTAAWTKADLDAAQIGVRISTDTNDYPRVSTLWLLVEHQPAAGSFSPSISPSVSPSLSPSASPSVSPSVSVSPSLSPSLSPSVSPSVSPSPSPGWSNYTRGNYDILPTNDNDLETAYTAGDVTDVSTKNDVRVAQSATDEFAVHQYKDYVGASGSCNLEWEGQSDLAAGSSTVYLQIYNRNTTTWDTVDSDSTSAANADFSLTATVADLTNYKDAGSVISCRVYQDAI